LNLIEQNFDTSCFINVGIRQGRTSAVLSKIEKIDSAIANFIKTV